MHHRLLPALAGLCLLLPLLGGPAGAQTADAGPVRPLVFPVIGKVTYSDTFGHSRSGGRQHEGQDLLGTKLQEIVAAADGRVTYLATGSLSGHMLEIAGDDGWLQSYLHLNNDTPGTDDGAATRADTFGPGIEEGARVTAGQLLGYLGDSGNAEGTTPHLHFELEDPTGSKVNPYASLQAATVLAEPAGTTSPIARLAGADRQQTAIEVSRAGWPDGADDVVLAAGDRYAEALPAAVLAAARSGPLLLSGGPSLAPEVAAELDRLNPTRVTVVGSVPQAVAEAMAAPGRAVTRVGVAGDPIATAVALARAVGGDAGVAVLVNGDRYADGISAATIAAGRAWPVLLTTQARVPQATVDEWRRLGVRTLVLVGGTEVIGRNIEDFASASGRCAGAAGCTVERLAGADRYATSVTVAERSLTLGGRAGTPLLVSTGTAYADALASGPLAARQGGLVVLVDGTGGRADSASRAFVAGLAPPVSKVSILGGRDAVTVAADRALQEVLVAG